MAANYEVAYASILAMRDDAKFLTLDKNGIAPAIASDRLAVGA
jgi:hypothetical protein